MIAQNLENGSELIQGQSQSSIKGAGLVEGPPCFNKFGFLLDFTCKRYHTVFFFSLTSLTGHKVLQAHPWYCKWWDFPSYD